MDLGGNMATQVYNSWGTGVRIAWDVPRATRGYLVHHDLSGELSSVLRWIFFPNLKDNFAHVNWGHCCLFGYTQKYIFRLFLLMPMGVNAPVPAFL